MLDRLGMQYIQVNTVRIVDRTRIRQKLGTPCHNVNVAELLLGESESEGVSCEVSHYNGGLLAIGRGVSRKRQLLGGLIRRCNVYSIDIERAVVSLRSMGRGEVVATTGESSLRSIITFWSSISSYCPPS